MSELSSEGSNFSSALSDSVVIELFLALEGNSSSSSANSELSGVLSVRLVMFLAPLDLSVVVVNLCSSSLSSVMEQSSFADSSLRLSSGLV